MGLLKNKGGKARMYKLGSHHRFHMEPPLNGRKPRDSDESKPSPSTKYSGARCLHQRPRTINYYSDKLDKFLDKGYIDNTMGKHVMHNISNKPSYTYHIYKK